MTQQNFRKYFTLYFIVFGIVISLFGAIISYSFQINDIQKELDKKAKEISDIKINTMLKPTMASIDSIVKSLGNNTLVKEYILSNNQEKKQGLEDIFSTIVSSNNIIMQARLLDKEGQELIRIDKKKSTQEIFSTDEKKFQNKKNRDYFKTLSTSNKEDIWYSKIDLNIEHEKIEIPYKSTLRVAIPLRENNEFLGIVIVNILMDSLFDSIGVSSSFDHFIIDKDQNYILHKNNEFSLNKYKNIKRDIKRDFPNGLNAEGVYLYDLKDIIKNDDNAVLIFKTKKDYKKQLFAEKINTSIIIFLLTVLLSLIMAIFVSKTPIELQSKLFKANKKLNEFTLIIDQYVITATTKPDSSIVNVSSAFEKISGYSKKELLDKPMSMLKHPNRDKKIIEELWSTILKGQTWIGEFQNKNKNGEEYWLEQHIIPKINPITNNIETFVSISIDITTKKEIEKIASIDKLTSIYNRRMLDEFLLIELDIAKRHKKDLSLILLDIDYFKKVNDTFGHLVGDKVLKDMAFLISKNLRTSDIFGRYGGEEFLIICIQTDSQSAFLLAEKLRKIIENHKFNEVGKKTMSLGISSYEENDSKELLFKKADEALYCAKKEGRNKSIIYTKKPKSI